MPVQPDAVPSGGAAKAMENYRQFLELQNADPKLRAEAMRRLGDLNLESGELERMANEVTQLDMQGAEAIQLYTARCSRPIRTIRATIRCSISWRAPTRPPDRRDQALATLDSIVARYPQSRDIAEVQFRRGELLFSEPSLPRGAARLRGGARARPQRLGLLSPEPLQARLVAVQAGHERGQPASRSPICST